MTTVTLPPGYRTRGLAVLMAIDPRWDPEARRSVQHEPEAGPQDRPDDLRTLFGFPLWVYFLGVIFSTGFLVALAGAGLHGDYHRAVAAFTGALLWVASLSGVMDYAARGARR